MYTEDTTRGSKVTRYYILLVEGIVHCVMIDSTSSLPALPSHPPTLKQERIIKNGKRKSVFFFVFCFFVFVFFFFLGGGGLFQLSIIFSH